MRVHVALGVTDLPSAVDDYTRLLGREPELVIPDAYALFRTRELNLSLRVTAGEAGQVRHLGFELDEPTPFEAISVGGAVTWELFDASGQADEIRAAWPSSHYVPAPPPSLGGAALRTFADEHVATWNRHDLEAILALYTDDVELTSPLAERVIGTSTIRGRDEVRKYFEAALTRFPDLRFELVNAYGSVGSATLVMRTIEGRTVAEVLTLEPDLRISRVIAHYEPARSEPARSDSRPSTAPPRHPPPTHGTTSRARPSSQGAHGVGRGARDRTLP